MHSRKWTRGKGSPLWFLIVDTIIYMRSFISHQLWMPRGSQIRTGISAITSALFDNIIWLQACFSCIPWTLTFAEVWTHHILNESLVQVHRCSLPQSTLCWHCMFEVIPIIFSQTTDISKDLVILAALGEQPRSLNSWTLYYDVRLCSKPDPLWSHILDCKIFLFTLAFLN